MNALYKDPFNIYGLFKQRLKVTLLLSHWTILLVYPFKTLDRQIGKLYQW